MSEIYVIEEVREILILVGISVNENDDALDSMEELKELVRTAGAEVAGVVLQNRDRVHSGTYVGKGKVEEIREKMEQTGANGIVCDDELSPAQMKNLEDELNCKVMDRTLVILDIFARHARTSEGKIQVEMAQLKYRRTRLTGFGRSMSRLGGGIGTRGPGETKLETDRRQINARIAQLRSELEAIIRHREVARNRRRQQSIPVVAVVGYTNAGKSTLLNRLTGADILEEDKLFATLDATTRKLVLPDKQEALLTDTVGFIRKLPHHLVEAFRSTLEEAKYADILIHVVDASNPQWEKHMHIVYETLHELGIEQKPIITLFNKQDLLGQEEILRDFAADKTIKCAVGKNIGTDAVCEALEEILRESKAYIEELFPYAKAGDIARIRKSGELISEEYREDGIFVKAYLPKRLKAELEIGG
ncbi:MAG: GTPase HflX [Eubacterium sp.]|nr:GTPase HflX [Eubacterium sp.]